MEEAPENGKKSSHSAHANRMNGWITEDMSLQKGTTNWTTKINFSGMGNVPTLNVAHRLGLYPRNMVASLPSSTATPSQVMSLRICNALSPVRQHALKTTQCSSTVSFEVKSIFFSKQNEKQTNMLQFDRLSCLLLHTLNTQSKQPHTSVSNKLKFVHKFPEKVNVYRLERKYI